MIFSFVFAGKTSLLSGLAKKKGFGLTLLSRNSPEKGRFLLIIIFARQSCPTTADAVQLFSSLTPV